MFDVVLAKELTEPAELIAKNVYELCARNRIDQGWILGSVSNEKFFIGK